MKSLFQFFTYLSLSCLVHGTSGQTPEQNLMKYWKHRKQLDNFILRGEGIDPSTVHGSYLPAEHRRTARHPGQFPLGDNMLHFRLKWPDLVSTTAHPTCGGLNIGADATMYLGWYIGVLATEYRLIVNYGTGQSQAVLEELWSALEAYERLDKMAETTQKTDLIYT